MGGPRDRTYRGYLLRENPWLQLQGGNANSIVSLRPQLFDNFVRHQQHSLGNDQVHRFGGP